MPTLSRNERVVAALAASELFSSLPADSLASVASQAELLPVPAGTQLIKCGGPPDALFVVAAGRLRAVNPDASDNGGMLDEIGPGGVFGELGLLGRQPRAASVVAIRDSEVVRLTAAAFRRITKAHTAVLWDLGSKVVKSFTHPRRRASPVSVIAVVGAGSSPPRLKAFAQGLGDGLSKLGSTVVLTSGALNARFGWRAAQLGPDETGSDDLARWLAAVEQQHQYVVCCADRGPTEWTKRCLRQADRILVVGRGGTHPGLSEVESALLPDHGMPVARRELVLLHASGARPADTAGWLEPRQLSAHHHVRDGNKADHARVARLVTGRSTAVVLGGGGARGFCHLGVLQALEDAGVTIDAIGGSSIGAIMAGCFAMGWDAETRREKVLRTFIGTRRLVGLTPPAMSLSSSRKLTGLLRHAESFSDQTIENLFVPFFCVSTNLSRGAAVVHDRGPMWWAVRASISLPGVFPPVWSEGELLVDGGVLEDVPVHQMRQRAAGRIIAVDLNGHPSPGHWAPFPPTINGWQAARARLRGHKARLPGPIDVVLRAHEAASRRGQTPAAALADLVIQPPTNGVGTLDFRGAVSLIDLAYRHTSAVLEDGPVTNPIGGCRAAIEPSRSSVEKTESSGGHSRYLVGAGFDPCARRSERQLR